MEFALVLPLFLLITIGMMEFARAFNVWQVVVNSARIGARIAALPPGAQSSTALVESAVETQLSSNGLDPALADVEIEGIDGGPGSTARVTVEYPYTFTYFGGIATLLGGDDPGSLTVASTTRMRNE